MKVTYHPDLTFSISDTEGLNDEQQRILDRAYMDWEHGKDTNLTDVLIDMQYAGHTAPETDIPAATYLGPIPTPPVWAKHATAA